MNGKKHSFLVILVIFLTILFCAPLILTYNKIVVEESYLQHCSYLDLNLIHFAKDHKIPFWAFHFGGGYPFIKHPENISTSPLFYMLILPFGSDNGLKLFLFFSYLIGVVGFYLFANRIAKFNSFTSTITTMFFIFNSFIPFQINTGNIYAQGWLYLPLITYTLFRSKRYRPCIFYCAGLITLLFLNGFNLYLPSMSLFLLIFVLPDAILQFKNPLTGQKSILVNFFLIILLAFFLGAVKSFPLLELLKLNIRPFHQYGAAACGAMTFKKMILAFLSRGPYACGNEWRMGLAGLGMGSVMYFGIIPMALFTISSIFCFKKAWKYLVTTLIFLCLSATYNCPVDLFYLLWHLPLFHSMHETARFFSFPAIFMISITTGFFFSSRLFINLRRNFKLLIYLTAIVGAVEMFIANTKYYEFTASHQDPVPGIQTEADFFNVKTVVDTELIKNIPNYDSKKEWRRKTAVHELAIGLQYYLLRQNIGRINWYGNISLDEKAEPKYRVMIAYGDYWKNFRKDLTECNGVIENKDYQGECFFTDRKKNNVNNIEWKTNEIIIDVKQISPDKLIINQNYDKEWESNIGNVCNTRGRLSIVLDKPVAGKIILTYNPQSFYIGLTVSMASAILCLGYFFIIPGLRKHSYRFSHESEIFSSRCRKI